jgi:hypothetical protein
MTLSECCRVLVDKDQAPLDPCRRPKVKPPLILVDDRRSTIKAFGVDADRGDQNNGGIGFAVIAFACMSAQST